MSKYKLRVTKDAEQDLNDLYSEGFETWGEKQADRYYEGLLARFDRMCVNPMLDRVVDEIRTGYRRSVYEKHLIYCGVSTKYLGNYLRWFERCDLLKSSPRSFLAAAIGGPCIRYAN